MRACLTIACVAASLLSATAAPAQNPPAPTAPAVPTTLAMTDCHPTSFGKLVDVTTMDGRTLRASIRCLDPQNLQLLRDGVVTTTPLTDVRRIVTRPDPIWDGFVKGAAIPLLLTAIFCPDCLDQGYTWKGALAYGLIGLTWDQLQPNRKTIYDSGGRLPSVSVQVPVDRIFGWGGKPASRR